MPSTFLMLRVSYVRYTLDLQCYNETGLPQRVESLKPIKVTISMNQRIIWVAFVMISTAAFVWASTNGPSSFPARTSAFDSSTSIHQEIDFKANPRRVYLALLDSKQFSEFSGMPAEIDAKVGGAFKCFSGIITGRTIELVPNKRIVQAWRSKWPDGVYSIVKFELQEQGSGTRVILDHRGFPDGDKDDLASGWNSHYWEPLQKYLAQ